MSHPINQHERMKGHKFTMQTLQTFYVLCSPFLSLEHKIKMAKYSIVKDFLEFGKETTIHGLNHVLTDFSSKLKRILWLLVLLFLLIYAGSLLRSSISSKILMYTMYIFRID